MNAFLEDMAPETLAAAIENNAVACAKYWARWPKLRLFEEHNMVLTLSNIRFPFFNNVFAAQFRSDECAAAIDGVLTQAKALNLPMFWWTGPSTEPDDLGSRLEDKKFSHLYEAAGMAVDLSSLGAGRGAPPELSIRQVRTPVALRSWAKITTTVFEFPDFATAPWFDMHATVGFDGAYRHYLGLLRGVPVAAASMFFREGVAGISNVATLAHERRRGIGSAITLEALLDARREDCRIGVLFASEAGKGIYEKLGFGTYCTGSCYLWDNG